MINHLLKQDCSYIRIEGIDGYGDPIESDSIPAKCRAIETFEMVKNNAGEEVVSSIQFWFNSDIDLDSNTITERRIKYDGSTYTPISVANRRNTLGESIFKVVMV
ncbi:hypothetical protein [Virgibacillus sp. CBA3643]|uniref:hypothetical protein n=1 Tax=Virgibacillus sp. CBA3643 TaxID=2942278 RepID=UPI0035A3CC9D